MQTIIRPLDHLEGKNIVVYDCEIVNIIDNVNVKWTDFNKMGLSVGVLFDYADMDYKVYLERDVEAICNRLNNADLVVGFNTSGFDQKLLVGSGGSLRPDLKNWDMLFHSRVSTGWSPNKRFPSAMTLDHHLEATFGAESVKTMRGSEAPIEWQKGNYGKVITYCIADVKREKRLFEQIWQYGWVKTAAHGQRNLNTTEIEKVVYGG